MAWKFIGATMSALRTVKSQQQAMRQRLNHRRCPFTMSKVTEMQRKRQTGNFDIYDSIYVH